MLLVLALQLMLTLTLSLGASYQGLFIALLVHYYPKQVKAYSPGQRESYRYIYKDPYGSQESLKYSLLFTFESYSDEDTAAAVQVQ